MEIEMNDGSKYEINEKWEKALKLKYEDNIDEVIEAFKDEVEDHFNARTVPDKLGQNHDWEEMSEMVHTSKETYEDHSELACSVMYPVIRAPLMSLAFSELDSDASVMGISDEGVTEYKDGKTKEHGSIEKALDEE